MRVVVAGYGIEGQANYQYWKSLGHEVAIIDENPGVLPPKQAEAICEVGAFSRIDELQPDMVVRTAGLSPHKLHTRAKVWSATNEFFARCPAPIIGVTGTKGKGTTCSFIASILREAGQTVHLVGNIGTPALSVLSSIASNDVVVYELSSFQLWDLEKSPHVAVVLMVEADHLDVHADMDEYIGAKSAIARWQQNNDVIVYNETNKYSSQIAEQSHATRRYTFPYDLGDLSRAVLLPGKHNLDNASAAILAVQEYVTDISILLAGLSNFKGLDHRLKYVGEIDEVKYYDDSIATTPGSAIAALESFAQPKILILGGSSKKADFSLLFKQIARQDVRHVILIGVEGERMINLCKDVDTPCTYIDGTMSDIVRAAHAVSRAGDVVVLSPACASFGMFKNYQDRGDQFIDAVTALAKRDLLQ